MKIKEGKCIRELAIIIIKIEDAIDEIPMTVNHKSMRKSITLWIVFLYGCSITTNPAIKRLRNASLRDKGRILNCIGLVGF